MGRGSHARSHPGVRAGRPAFVGLTVASMMAILGAHTGVSAQAQRIVASVPDTPEPSTTYVFYLHGRIIETGGRRPTHAEFGPYEYDEILKALAGNDRVVISEQRSPDTVTGEYAELVAGQVRDLLKRGVAPERIAVVGFSKGGGIAIAVSSLLREPITYAFLAACNPGVFGNEDYRVSGRVLSVYEESDEIGVSCAPLLARSPAVLESKEVRISTGARHGAFYTPRAVWVDEVVRWIEEGGG